MAGSDGVDYDILILGGGLVGNALACALDGGPWRVAQVEASAPQAGAPGFDERKLALAQASLNALSALGVLPLLASAPAPIRRVHVSREGDFGAVRLEATQYGRDAFGAVVLARELGQALEARLQACVNLTRYRPASVQSFAADDHAHALTVDADGAALTLRTRLLVAADGTASAARAALGIGVQAHDYGQTLLVCSVATDRPADGTAYERFTEQGPVALLPMAGGHYGGICGVAAADAGRVLAMDDAAYRDYLQGRFGWRAGRVIRVGTRSAYPIVRAVADKTTASRAVLVGNAAQTLHPIGAQGFNLGLRDALCLAQVLAGPDAGAPEGLAAYAAMRCEDRERTLAFSDGLARATANPARSMHALRSLGLLALGHVPGLAEPLVSGAMGFRGEVPQLARHRT
jgi:2-octaprenyl-6-methoxyphenol hydroxylase